MLIDHPEVGRELFATAGAYPTHDGAAALFTDLAPQMDAYSAEYAEIAEPAWEREFIGTGRKKRKCGHRAR
jgi:hypothetical protein